MQVVSPEKWQTPKRSGENAITLTLRITNRSARDLLFNLFDTVVPEMKDAKNNVRRLDHARDATMVPKPVLVKAGAVEDVRYNAQLALQGNKQFPDIQISDNTGGVWTFHDLVPGAYTLRMKYENATPAVSQMSGPHRWPGVPADAPLWVGKVDTPQIAIAVEPPSDPSEVPRAGDGRLRATVTPNETLYRMGEAVTVTFTVENVSQEPVAVWSHTCSWGHKVYSFEATLQDNRTIIIDEPPIEWRRNVPSSVVLKPGEKLARDFDLNLLSQGPLPCGAIRVRGVYASKNDFARDPETAKRLGNLWTGRLVTDAVYVGIEPTWSLPPRDVPEVVYAAPGGHGPWMLLLPLGSAGDQGLKVGDGMTLTMFGPKIQPPHPLAVVRLDKLYPEADLATVTAVPGRQFDAVDLRDLAIRDSGNLAKLEITPGPATAARSQSSGPAEGPPRAGGSSTRRSESATLRLPLRVGPMAFEAVLDRDAEKQTCTLRVDRLDSREEKGKRYTLWSTSFSSWPDAIELKDGRLVARNAFHTWLIDPLTGATEKTIDAPAKAPARP
jgi:hypothetical protein